MKRFYASGGDILDMEDEERCFPSSMGKYPAGVWGREAPTAAIGGGNDVLS